MKKSLLLFLGLMLFLPAAVSAQTFDYEYEGVQLSFTPIDDETCKAFGFASGFDYSNVEELVIPEKAVTNRGEVYTVVSIGGGFSSKTALKRVILPSTVKSIGSSAFSECTALEEFPSGGENIETIGNYAFRYCTSLEKVVIGNKVTTIGDEAFSGCTNLKDVTLGESLETIGRYAFYKDAMLTEISFPASLKTVGNSAFSQSGINKISHASIESLCSLAYPNLNSRPYVEQLYVAGEEVSEVVIPESVTSVADYAFAYFKNITSVKFMNPATTIGKQLFQNCSALTDVELPAGLETIPESTFNWCSALTSIKIPNRVKSIGNKAFLYTHLTDVLLPPLVETIGEQAFYIASGLAFVKLGPNVTTIGASAFCTPAMYSDVYITAQTPPSLVSDSFTDFTNTLYVQGEDALNAYKADATWCQFSNIILMEEATSVSANYTVISGKQGDTFQLSTTFEPANAALTEVFWHSTMPEIASVDADGLVTLHVDSPDATPSNMSRAEAEQCKIVGETLYSNGPVVEVPVDAEIASVDFVENDANSCEIDFAAPFVVYSISGVRMGTSLDKLVRGIYVVRQGSLVKKYAVR